MAEQILIELVADTSKIQPAVEILQKLGQISDTELAEIKKLTDAASKGFDSMNKSANTTVPTLQKIEKVAASLSNSFIEGFQEGVAGALADAGVSVKDFEKALNGSLQPTLDETQNKSKSLRTRLREVREELAAMETAGQEGTAAFQKLQVEAAKLDDQMGDTQARIRGLASDTANLDAAVQGVQTLAAGFGIAQGAAALLGNEDEELMKTMVKLQAVMAISNGFREIQLALQAQSILRLKAESVGQAVLAASTRLTAATFGVFGVSVAATSTAFKVLRAAIITTGIGALVVALGFAAEKLMSLGSAAEEAAEKQQKLNEEFDQWVSKVHALDEIDALNANRLKGSLNDRKRELELLKSGNALKSQIYEQEQKVRDAELDDIQRRIALNRLDVKDAVDRGIGEDKINELKKEGILLDNQRLDKLNETRSAQVAFQKEVEADKLKSATATAQALAIMAKEGSQEQLNAQIDAVKRAATEELNNVHLTEGERLRIRANVNKQIGDLQLEYEKKQLQSVKDGIDAQIFRTKEGSKEELDFKLQSIQLSQQLELKEQGLTANKKREIEARYLRQRNDLIRVYNKQAAEDAINTRLSDVNTALAAFQRASTSQNDKELLRLKKQAIDEQSDLDELNARDQIQNQDLLQAKLKEIWEKAAADKRAIDEQFKINAINTQTDIANAEISNEIKIQQIVLNSSNSSLSARITARKKIGQLQQDAINNEALALEKLHDNGLIAEEEYQKKLLEIKGKYLDLEIQNEQKKEQLKQQIREASIGVLQQISDALFEGDAQKRQAALDSELSRLDAQKQKEVDAKNITEQQKADIENRYAEKIRQLKIKDWKAEQKAKQEQAVINGALAITNILATRPKFDLGIGDAIMIAAAVASTAIQVAKIKSQPVPQFAKGTRNAPRGYAWVGEEGPELVHLKGGEKIWTHNQSKRVQQSWESGVPASPDEIISGHLPSRVDPDIISRSYVLGNGALALDYEKLGQSLAKHIPAPVQNNISIDKNGLQHYILQSGNKTKILNQRYKMNG